MGCIVLAIIHAFFVCIFKYMNYFMFFSFGGGGGGEVKLDD